MDAVTAYEVFRDLLNIFLALAAVAAALVAGVIYKIHKSFLEEIEEKVKERVTSAAKTEMYKALVRYHISCGFDYWRVYDHMEHLFSMDRVSEDALNGGKISKELEIKFENMHIPLSKGITITTEKEDEWVITDKEKKNIFVVRKEEGKPHIYKRDIWKLNQAIETTELGYDRYISELDEQERESELLICWIKNNLAYYYAERRKFEAAKPGDAVTAQKFVKYVHNRIDKYPEEEEDWIHTYKFVQQQFPLNR